MFETTVKITKPSTQKKMARWSCCTPDCIIDVDADIDASDKHYGDCVYRFTTCISTLMNIIHIIYTVMNIK